MLNALHDARALHRRGSGVGSSVLRGEHRLLLQHLLSASGRGCDGQRGFQKPIGSGQQPEKRGIYCDHKGLAGEPSCEIEVAALEVGELEDGDCSLVFGDPSVPFPFPIPQSEAVFIESMQVD